jgi:hypothetical protein
MLLIALLALVGLVAACGSETNSYRGDVDKVQKKYLKFAMYA